MGSQNAGRAPFHVTDIRQTVAPNGAGNGAALASIKCHTLQIKAICPAGQTVYLGRTADGVAALSVANGFPLNANEWEIFEVKNANEFCILASAAGASIATMAGAFY